MTYYIGTPGLRINRITTHIQVGGSLQIMLPQNRFVTFSRKTVANSVILTGWAK